MTGEVASRLLLLAALVVSWGDSPAAVAAENTDAGRLAARYSGTFRDDRVTIELATSSRGANPTNFTGAIRLAEQRFPLKAILHNGVLAGTFESQGDEFEFSAALDGQRLVFTTEGTTYRLKKQSVNPLARPAAPNPVVQPTPEASATPSQKLRFVTETVRDDDTMIGGEAFRFLVPAGWKFEGGVRWRNHPSLPAYLVLRISNPSGSEALEILPTLPFVWPTGGNPLFPAGSNYLGYEVREPTDDPADFIKRITIPRLRPHLFQAKVVKTDPLSKVADAIAAGGEEPGMQKTIKAARVRFEYAVQGKTIHEDVYGVLVLVHATAMNATFWGTDRNYSFRAEKGTLDERMKTLQTMIASVKPTMEWFNRYVQLVQILAQNPLDPARPVTEMRSSIARTTGDVNELRRQAYESAQTAHERISASFRQYVPGLGEYHNPIENRNVLLPVGYSQMWVNAQGEYVLNNDAAFDPNMGAKTKWQRLEKKE